MEKYIPKLDIFTTQQAIADLRRDFESRLSSALNLIRVTAPLFVQSGSGINDDLNGVERPVSFDIMDGGENAEVVHSLAKWKRMALGRYCFPLHTGLYTDMNAIRRDEKCDNIHSVYVDQWDWEKVISAEDRNTEYLKDTVKKIYSAITETAAEIEKKYPALDNYIEKNIKFISTYELEQLYPKLSPKERENEAAKKFGAIFLMQIGDKLRNGQKHDGRAPDYDDWHLNGDIIVYNRVTDAAFEISSMGIRVDKASLLRQLKAENADDRLQLPFHKALMSDELPLTIGGGIGQSRLCMLLLQKLHIGEVHCSVWPEKEINRAAASGAVLL